MMDSGVTMERLTQPQERRERTGIVQIVMIAAILAASLYGGLQLLGDTHARFNQRQQEKAAEAAAIRKAANRSESEREKAILMELTRKREIRRQDEEAAYQRGDMRCIGGQVFRRIPNGWENVPGRGC